MSISYSGMEPARTIMKKVASKIQLKSISRKPVECLMGHMTFLDYTYNESITYLYFKKASEGRSCSFALITLHGQHPRNGF